MSNLAERTILPLAGVRVLDIATMLAAPMIATVLGDYGAEVTKVEHPQGDPLRKFGWIKRGTSLWWKFLHRNKKGITLNLSHPKGQALLKELVPKFDILIENFRPGTLERWGLGYNELAKINPRLILVRVTGFGQTGPYKDRPGFGTLIEAMSSFAYCNGFPDGPPTLPPGTLGDAIAGLTGAIAVMVALHYRDTRSGEGQYIDLSILEPLFALMGPLPAVYEELGIIPGRTGNRTPFVAPRNAYRTKDDRWVALSAGTQSIAERVMGAIGREDLIQDPRFKDNESRLQNVEALDESISNWMAEHTCEEALQRFEECEAALAPFYNIEDIMNDLHFREREAIVEIPDPDFGKLKMPNIPPRLSKTPGKIRCSAPALGEHNYQIFIQELGLTEQELAELKGDGVI